MVALVLNQMFWIAAIGALIGLLLSALAAQVLSMLLVGVSPIDPLTFLIAAGVCGAVALAAAYVPVHRAIRIDASDALRYE
jgi:ABC-type antimicrobial peptide transport system permease subunit